MRSAAGQFPGVFERFEMNKSLALRLLAIPSAVAASMGTAMAALPTEVTTAITNAQTDMTALYSALTTAGAALFVAGLIYRRFKLK